MHPLDLATLALILGLAATLQSAVGFGMAIAAIPLLVLAGHPLPHAVALVLGAALVQTSLGSWATREHIRWRAAFAFAGMQWVALLGGVACMSLLVESEPAHVRRAVGVVVVAAVTAQRLFRPAPRARLAAAWTGLAATCSGFFAGLVGMGGPPLVLFALAHDWSPDRIRAFLWSQFLLAQPVLATLLVLRFGGEVLGWLALGAAMAPVIWLGSRVGRGATRLWDRGRMELAATVVLYAIGASSFV